MAKKQVTQKQPPNLPPMIIPKNSETGLESFHYSLGKTQPTRMGGTKFYWFYPEDVKGSSALIMVINDREKMKGYFINTREQVDHEIEKLQTRHEAAEVLAKTGGTASTQLRTFSEQAIVALARRIVDVTLTAEYLEDLIENLRNIRDFLPPEQSHSDPVKF